MKLTSKNYDPNTILVALDFGGRKVPWGPTDLCPLPRLRLKSEYLCSVLQWCNIHFLTLQYSSNCKSVFLSHSYPQLNIFAICEAKILSSMSFLQTIKDLQNKQTIGRRFTYKCSHPTIRPALPRDFLHSRKSCIFSWLSKLDANGGQPK